MGYLDLGASLPIVAAPDTTGQNTGNLTLTVDSESLMAKVGNFEIWHMVLEDVLPGAAAIIRWNSSRTFGFVAPQNGGSEWWGVIPMRQGDSLYFLWSLDQATDPPPQLTVYMRYDPSLPGNS